MNAEIQSTLNNGTFCNLSVSVWQASKKVAKGMIAVGHDADENLFRVQKDLVERSHLKAIRQAAQNAGAILHDKSLPFQIRGVYYVPNTLIIGVTEQIQHHEREFWRAVEEFCARFGQYRDEARARLNGHFSEKDYPQDIGGKFAWGLQMMAFSAPNQLQAVSPEMYQQAMSRFQNDIQEFRENSVALLREKLAELVGHMVERLTPEADGTRKIFRNSMVGNLREFLADFENLNITNDQQLAEQVGRVHGLLQGVQADDLRNSSYLANMVSRDMAKVQEAMLGMIEKAPKRRIRYQPSGSGDGGEEVAA